MARAALANSRGSFSSAGTVDRERVAAIEAALAAIGDRHDPMKARLLAQLAIELVWVADLDRRDALSAEALAVARRLGDLDVLGSVLALRAMAIWHVSTVEERLELTAEVAEIAERTQDPTLTFHARYRNAVALMESGGMEEANRHLLALEQLVGEGLMPQPYFHPLLTFSRATMLVAGGRLEEAEAASREALAMGQATGQADAPCSSPSSSSASASSRGASTKNRWRW